MNRLFSNLARVITSRGSTTLPNFVKNVSAVVPPRCGELSGSRAFYYYFFVFSFLATHTAHTHEPIPMRDNSKDAVWRKKVPSKQVFFKILTLWGLFSPKAPQIWPAVGKSQPKWKGRITLKRLKIGKKCQWSMNINLGHPFRIRQRKLRTAPPSGEITMTSFPVCKKTSFTRKRCMIGVKLLWNTNGKP